MTISSDRILTANVGESNLTGWNLCLKVETTTGSTEDYKLYNDNGEIRHIQDSLKENEIFCHYRL